jgi:hypothetical protein
MLGVVDEVADPVDTAELMGEDTDEVVAEVGLGAIEVVVDWAEEDASRLMEKSCRASGCERLLLE